MGFLRPCVGGIALWALVVTGGMLGQTSLADPPPKKEKPTSGKATPPKPSKLDPELEAALKTAPNASQWPNYDYVRLLDIGNITIKSDGTIVAEYRETYKLFNERARRLAEVTLPYNSSYQSMRIVHARTIKKDGTVLEVKPDDVRITSPFSEYLMYDDAVGMSFSMPGVEDDCIIDYTFQQVTRPLLMPGQFWLYWGFTGPEPVSLCRYTIRTPADKALKFKVYNDETLQPKVVSALDGHTKTYTWERRDLKPIELEPAMPSIRDVRVWLEATSINSWQDVSSWFWGLQKPQAEPNDAIRTTVKKLVTDKMTEEEKARVIYDWVANRTRYVGIEIGMSAYKPHAATEVHKNLYGDCKDKATLLISMLGLAGIKAHPVLLHAENRRPVSDGLPNLNAFNHCIALAEVSGKEVWLDATAETCAYGDIPDGDRGVEALVVRGGAGKFQTIPRYQAEENGMDLKSTVVLKPDGSAEAKSDVAIKGAGAHSMRAAVRSLSPEKRKEMVQRIAQSFSSGATVKDSSLSDTNSKDGPYVMKMTMAAPNYAKKTGSLMLIPLSNNATNREMQNPFIKEQRVWPIVEEDTTLTVSETVYTLPEGYGIEELPSDTELHSPLHSFLRKFVKSADGKTVTVTETISEKPGTVPASDYSKIKSYYEAALKVADEQIVLRKAK